MSIGKMLESFATVNPFGYNVYIIFMGLVKEVKVWNH